jgi:hypothetical protein
MKDKGASSSKACFITSFRSWEHVYTHTQGLICNTRFVLGDATPHTLVFLIHGF